MASALEVAEKIAADKEAAAGMAAMFAAAKQQAEETVAALAALGVEGRAARMQKVVDALEEAESGRVILEGSLEKARWQVMSAVHGKMGPGARGSGPGGAIVPLKAVGGPDGVPPQRTPDILPPHERRGDPSGEELMGIDPSLGPFQKEHEGANDDARKTKSQRLGRSFVRNAGDLADSAKQNAATSTIEIEDDFDPWGPTAETTVEVPTGHPPVYATRIDADDIKVGDVVGTTIVVAAFAIEALSRLGRKKDDG